MGHRAQSRTRLEPRVVAAFVDGTLDAARRRQVLAVLAASAADRRVLADMARMLEEEEGG